MSRRKQPVGTLALAAALMFAGPANAEDAGSGKPEPQNVDKMAVELLNVTINLAVTDMKMDLAWEWAAKLSNTKLPIILWPKAAAKKVSLTFEDAPLAEVLRKVKEQTGAEHRFRDGKVHLLMPDEVAAFEKGEDPKPAAEEGVKREAASDQPAPQKVGDEAQMLMKKVTLEMVDAPLAEALGFLTTLSQVPVACDGSVAKNNVTLKLANATMAEALKQIKETAGGEHRVVDGVIHIASPEQWKAIDAGKAKFAKAEGDNPVLNRDAKLLEPQKDGSIAVAATSMTGVIGDDGSVANASTQVTTNYEINGKNYTEEELKKEKPEIWKSLQRPQEPRTVGPDAKVTINGKQMTAKEAKEQFPDMFKMLNLKIAE